MDSVAHGLTATEPDRRPLRVLGIFAHPDDETLCAGGTLAKYASAGADVRVVSLTKGGAGEILVGEVPIVERVAVQLDSGQVVGGVTDGRGELGHSDDAATDRVP